MKMRCGVPAAPDSSDVRYCAARERTMTTRAASLPGQCSTRSTYVRALRSRIDRGGALRVEPTVDRGEHARRWPERFDRRHRDEHAIRAFRFHAFGHARVAVALGAEPARKLVECNVRRLRIVRGIADERRTAHRRVARARRLQVLRRRVVCGLRFFGVLLFSFEPIHALEQRPRERMKLRRARASAFLHGGCLHGLRDRERFRARWKPAIGHELSRTRDLGGLGRGVAAGCSTVACEPENGCKREPYPLSD